MHIVNEERVKVVGDNNWHLRQISDEVTLVKTLKPLAFFKPLF